MQEHICRDSANDPHLSLTLNAGGIASRRKEWDESTSLMRNYGRDLDGFSYRMCQKEAARIRIQRESTSKRLNFSCTSVKFVAPNKGLRKWKCLNFSFSNIIFLICFYCLTFHVTALTPYSLLSLLKDIRDNVIRTSHQRTRWVL